MIRDLAGMSERTYDLVIIGGGITGVCIARDAALRGLSVALVDKGDFGHATTAASSKLIHGGLRYLQYLQLGVVRESLRERRIWTNIAPHMIDPLLFLVPTRRTQVKRALVLSAALTAYDLLSYDRNRLDDPEKSIPPHMNLGRDEALALEPGLASDDLRGAMTFMDYQMYSPERLALECLQDAVAHGAQAANYAAVTRFLADAGTVTGVEVRDVLSGGTFPLRGRLVVNAGGAWADVLMAQLGGGEAHRHLVRSKGIHILTRNLTNGHALGIQTKKAHFFILPWRGHSLIGTTDTVFRGEPDACGVEEQDILDFLAIVNEGYPRAQLTRADVLHFYAGLRPIIDVETGRKAGQGTYKASRAAEVYDHEVEDHLKGCITAIGGKWTTSRSLAKKVVDLAAAKLGGKYAPCATGTTPTHGGATGPFQAFADRMVREHPEWPETTLRYLAKNYGSRVGEVLALARENPAFAAPLTQTDIAAQVVHAVRREMALTLDDVLFRRTGLGTLGDPGATVVEAAAALMAAELGWDTAETARQVAQARSRFTPQGAAA